MNYSDTTWLIIGVCGGVIQGAIGALIGHYKGRTWAGFWFGFFLGVIGWLLVLLGPDLDDQPKVRKPVKSNHPYGNTVISADDPDIQAHLARKAQRGDPTEEVPVGLAEKIYKETRDR